MKIEIRTVRTIDKKDFWDYVAALRQAGVTMTHERAIELWERGSTRIVTPDGTITTYTVMDGR